MGKSAVYSCSPVYVVIDNTSFKIVYAAAMDVLNFNPMLNHCIDEKMILIGDTAVFF